MNVLGAVLLMVGLLGAAANYSLQQGGMLHEIYSESRGPNFFFNAALSFSLPMWLGLSVLGGVILWLNRRPSD